MLFRIEVTRSAEADIDAAYLWIFEQSPEHADRWVRGLYQTIFTLKEMPARCPVARERRGLGRKIRQLLYWQGRHAFRILYEIRDEMSSCCVSAIQRRTIWPLGRPSSRKRVGDLADAEAATEGW